MAKIFRPKRALQSKATTVNPVLAKGEMLVTYSSEDYGTSDSTNKLYIGDGSTSFTNLKPFIQSHDPAYATSNHNHDGTYYKKTDTVSNASTATYAGTAGAVAWANVSSKPSTFAPVVGNAATQAAAGNHNHDGTYYKKTDTVTNATCATNASSVGGFTVGISVPSDAKFNDTTYTNGTGIALSSNTFSLATTGTAGTYGPTANVTGDNGNTIKVPQITTDSYGRVTSVTERTYTSKNTTYGVFSTASAGLAPASGSNTGKFLRGDGGWHTPTDHQYFAGTGLNAASTSGNNTTFALSTSGATSGSYGPSADVSGTDGTTMAVPYITVDAYGRITSISNKKYTSKNTANTDHLYYAGTGLNAASTSGNNTTFALSTSGATSGSYGMANATTGTNNTNINIPYITVDSYGRVTSIGNKIYTSKDTTYSFSNIGPTLSWGNTSTIGTVGGVNLTVKMPSNPNTDTKNTAGSTDTSSKIFLVGATSQAANPQTYSDNEVYATSGTLTAKSMQVGGGAATIQYNSNTQSIDFVFAS